MLRYFDGYNPNTPNMKLVSPTAVGPGPTLRCELGDVVNITLLNQVKVQDFGGSLDSGEEGRGNGCDQATKINADGSSDKYWYPATDKYPNCFHGSSSANLHFHGTHVTPSTTGDNVLVNVRPDPAVTEGSVKEWFNQIFEHCELNKQPKKWEDLPQGWRDKQRELLIRYDQTAPYQGGHGLPPGLRLWPQNEEAIAQGVWPQWYIGSYPNCFQIPKYNPAYDPTCDPNLPNPTQPCLRMGQAPGTHWYHAHKHGSTSINLFNGMSGAMIITDNSPTGYDGKLKAFYSDKGGLKERVMIFQQFTAVPNMMSAAAPNQLVTPPLLVNGQYAPTISMRTGEVQLWRLINAAVQGTLNVTLPVVFKQTAQDGVQYAWENYSNTQNGRQNVKLAPANRMDLLVQAPTSAGCYEVKQGNATILYIKVTGNTVSSPTPLPSKREEYPELPIFLKDIDPAVIRVRREIVYNSRNSIPVSPVTRSLPEFLIDGKQFEDQAINQVMLLDTTEEWTVYNADPRQIAHPFHIHVNPFQVVEVFDPTNNSQPQIMPQPYVWWDTFALPPAKIDSSTKKVIERGYVKFRTRFVDFTGRYVQHCHILAHEDRGMMQLLEVVSNRTILKHH
jgi:FtsP/CotA-like multicopper oxidase with cupredoxin domain